MASSRRTRRASRPHLVVRHPHRRLAGLRGHPVRLVALVAVLGPGLLAGLSDDDPAGITTYSVLGAEHGYQLLWVLLVSTIALIVFHSLGARMGVVTGQGLIGLIRQRYGVRSGVLAVTVLYLLPRGGGDHHQPQLTVKNFGSWAHCGGFVSRCSRW